MAGARLFLESRLWAGTAPYYPLTTFGVAIRNGSSTSIAVADDLSKVPKIRTKGASSKFLISGAPVETGKE